MLDDRNGSVFVPRLVLFILVGVDIPCRFFRVKLDRCFPPYKYLAKCRGARPIRPRAPSTFLYFNSGRHAPAYIKRIEGKKYSILPKISQKIFLSKIYKVFLRPTADISAVGHFSYTTSCTVNLNVCPFAKYLQSCLLCLQKTIKRLIREDAHFPPSRRNRCGRRARFSAIRISLFQKYNGTERGAARFLPLQATASAVHNFCRRSVFLQRSNLWRDC